MGMTDNGAIRKGSFGGLMQSLDGKMKAAGRPGFNWEMFGRNRPKVQPGIPRDPARPYRGRAGLVFDQFRRERMR